MAETLSQHTDRYQLIEGQVFSIRRWPDGRVMRGAISVATFAAAFALAFRRTAGTMVKAASSATRRSGRTND